MRVAFRKRVNATIGHAPIGVMVKAGDLGLVRDEGSTRTRERCSNEFHHEK